MPSKNQQNLEVDAQNNKAEYQRIEKISEQVLSDDITIDSIHKALEVGININEPYSDKWTPLMFAVDSNKPEVVKFLLSHGADINSKIGNGMNALAWAQAKKPGTHDEIIKILTEATAQK